MLRLSSFIGGIKAAHDEFKVEENDVEMESFYTKVSECVDYAVSVKGKVASNFSGRQLVNMYSTDHRSLYS